MHNVFLAVDANSLFYRAYYAYPQSLTTAGGVPVNAVYGFLVMFFSILVEYKPKYVALAFDYDRDTFRKNTVAYYKDNRKEADATLVEQYRYLFNVLDGLGIKYIRVKGYEADDVIATCVKTFRTHGEVSKVVIVTGDKDLMQLLGGRTEIVYIRGRFQNREVLNSKKFKEKWGFSPQNWVDFQALKGDATDNIPGVKGIGDKGAQVLIQEFKTIEKLYKSLDKVQKQYSRYYNKLVDAYENARDSKFLAKLKTDVEISADINDYRVNKLNMTRAVEELSKLGFKSLVTKLKQLEHIYGSSNDESMQIVSDRVASAFMQVQINEMKNVDTVYLMPLKTEGLFAKSEWLLISNGVFCSLDNTALQEFLENMHDQIVVSYNIKDIAKKVNLLLKDPAKIVDLSLLFYLLNPGRRAYDLSSLSLEILGEAFVSFNDFRGGIDKYAAYCYDKLNRLYVVALDKASQTQMSPEVTSNWKYFISQNKKCDLYDTPVENLLFNMEVPLAGILAKMEKRGIRMNMDGLEKLEKTLTSRLESLQKQAYDLVGHEFNLNSPKQVAFVLFKELHLESKKKSTAINVLQELIPQHPVVKVLIKYRELSKLFSTYVNGFKKFIKQTRDGCIVSTTYEQTRVVTGRLSSTNPNLQNIPTKGEFGKEFRSLFIPRNGYTLVSFDYSQIELRILAHVSQDRNLLDDFNSGKDPHKMTAARLLNKPLEKITKSERKLGKTINFGVIYGLSAYGLSSRLDMDVTDAAEYIENYFDHYDGVKITLEDIINNVIENGYVETIYGRRRYIPFIKSGNKRIRMAAQREAINFPFQGSAADIIKLAMILVDKALGNDAHILLQIHDELVLEIKTELLQNVINMVVNIMRNVVDLSASLEVSAVPWNSK